MPENRVDAIGKADAATWSAASLSKGSPNVLKIISGQLSHMPTGEIMSAVVRKAARGAFKITLNGETFIIRGLPASLMGKAVSFVVRQSSLAAKNGMELFWLGPSRAPVHASQKTSMNMAKATGEPPVPLPMASFKLAVGDMVSALAQKRLPNGHIQLNIQGVSVETSAPKSIAQGDLLVLRMNRPPAGFQLISAHKNAAEKAMVVVKNNLSISHEPLTQSLAAMRNILPALAAAGLSEIEGFAQLGAWLTANTGEQNQPASGEHLARSMRDSGAALETKLLELSQKNTANAPQIASLSHDLKTIMLQLAKARSSQINHAGMIKMLTELSQRGAARIETNQALNVLAQMHGDPIRFEVPMLIGQQLVNVQISMQQQQQQPSEHPGDERGAEHAYNVLFALELSGLGKMRVDASISEMSVHARIYSDHTGVGQFIRDHIQRLETRLQDMGYKEVFLLASQIPPDAEKQRRFDQLTSMVPASLNLLDIIA